MEEAQKDISKHLKVGNKSVVKKLSKIILEPKEHQYTGEEQPEELKYNLKGLWFRRINNTKHIYIYI